MNLRIFESRNEAFRAAARAIEQRTSSGGSVALSGGSTPAPLYQMLSADESLRSRPIVWVTVDERWVPRSDPRSNTAMIERTLFPRGVPRNQRFLTFDTGVATAAESAARFEKEWNELGVANLDVIVLGVGDDGHTASLFPGTAALDVHDRIATEVFVPAQDMWRVTLTMPVIRAAGLRLILALGEEKRSIIRQIRDGADLPVVRATGGDLETWWIVDRAAAAPS